MISRNNMAFGLFALLILSVGFASATSSTYLDVSPIVTKPTSVLANAGTFTFTFTVNYTKGGDEAAVISFSESFANFGSVSIPSITLNGSENESKTVTGTASGFSGMAGLNMLVTISAKTSTYKDNETSFTVPIAVVPVSSDYEFCNWNGSKGYENGSDLQIRSIDDTELDNADAWQWRPLDNIEVEIDVKNTGDDDEDYVVEILFLDSNLNTVDVASDDGDLEQDVSIDEGDTETVVFNFAIDGDVDAGSYDMYVKVYQDGDEKLQCVSKDSVKDGIDDIAIEKDKHDVLVKSVSGSNSIKAGSTVTYEVDIANLGREDEDQVKIIAYNTNLGVSQFVEIEDLNSGDSETITFTIKYPADAEEGSYKITFSTEYNYDNKDDVYDDESASEDDYLFPVVILAGPTQPTIEANLESDALIGEQLIIKTTITNNGATGNFVISATGYESWAELVSIAPQTATLAKGDSIDALVTLSPKTSGVQSFKINTIVGGETYSQTVSVNIPSEDKGMFGDLSPAMVYLIGGIVVLVVIILLVLIIRLARGPKRKVSDY